MTTLEKIGKIEQIDQLIRLKATGPPKQLAKRLGISESSLYELLLAMKNMDAPICYCRHRQSYYYEKKVKFHFGFWISAFF